MMPLGNESSRDRAAPGHARFGGSRMNLLTRFWYSRYASPLLRIQIDAAPRALRRPELRIDAALRGRRPEHLNLGRVPAAGRPRNEEPIELR